MDAEMLYTLDELDETEQEVAFASWLMENPDMDDDDMQMDVVGMLEEFVDDPSRNRFIDSEGRVYAIEWPGDGQERLDSFDAWLSHPGGSYFAAIYREDFGDIFNVVELNVKPSGSETASDDALSSFYDFYRECDSKVYDKYFADFAEEVADQPIFDEDGEFCDPLFYGVE